VVNVKLDSLVAIYKSNKNYKIKIIRGIILVFLFLIFLLLSFLSKNYPYFQFDYAITTAIQSIDNELFKNIMIYLSLLGNEEWVIFSLIVTPLFLISIRKYKAAVLILFSGAGIVVLSFILKLFIGRPRPDPALIPQLGKLYTDNSFPSSHVLFFLGFYGFIFFLVLRYYRNISIKILLLVLLIIMISLIGISRIYLGVHWFSDTLGSYLLGSVWLYLMVFLYRSIQR
jgi:membrane-associated phospholipid phosphatase